MFNGVAPNEQIIRNKQQNPSVFPLPYLPPTWYAYILLAAHVQSCGG